MGAEGPHYPSHGEGCAVVVIVAVGDGVVEGGRGRQREGSWIAAVGNEAKERYL